MAEPVCSGASSAHGEPLMATAPMVRNWLLIEHPGAWGPEALSDSGLPVHVADGLAALAGRHALRILLIRRLVRPTGTGRQCFLVHSGRYRRWIEEQVVDQVDDLLGVDYSPMRDGSPVGLGSPRREPLYLVCTHGRHDQCCASLGRPVARALLARVDDAVWESSHVGGHRFAGNLVCLPHGLYFGRLSPPDAERVVAAYERGAVDLAAYRGRAGELPAAQAAEHFLRAREGLFGVDDLTVSGVRDDGEGVVAVGLDGPGGRSFDVRVLVGQAIAPRPVSCGGPSDERPPTYALVDVNAR